MFADCINLKSFTSNLTNLTNGEGMFYGCSNLNHIKMLATDISATDCLSDWVSGVASTGTFVKNPNMTSLPTGNNGIPSGWTVVNDGEESGVSGKIVNHVVMTISQTLKS